MSSAPCKAAIVTDQSWARKATSHIVLPIHRVGPIIRAREEERKKIARELHDDLGQEMASLVMEMGEAVQRCKFMTLENDMAKAMCQTLYGFHSRVAELTTRIGQVSHQLHPTVLEHCGLKAAIENLCTEFEVLHHVQVRYSARNLPAKINSDVSLCLYRITQEAFHNIDKHAQATAVDVTLTGYLNQISLIIRDNGVGFSTQPGRTYGGVGLASMQERALAVGGEFNLKTGPGKGTEIGVRVHNGE